MQVDTPASQGACVYCDDALIVLDKPSGLLSVPGRGPDKQDCAIARAQAHWPDALVVHRLDMATSGLLLLARGPHMQRLLSKAFESRQVHKTYIAVVTGHPTQDSGEIDLPLQADWPARPRQMVSPLGKPSLTRWRVLQRFVDDQGRPQSRLALEPVTGRSHQLRVHLQALGHPILGDTLYADDLTRSLSGRLLLHASELSLPHPTTGQTANWNSPAPF